MATPRATAPTHIHLRPTTEADLPALFEQQRDPESNAMAGTHPRSPESFRATWDQVFANPLVVPRVILADGVLVGGISCFQADGHDCIGYWVARPHWGRGIASRALDLLLREVTRRPLHATAARANAASIRVLENCGFRLAGYRMGEATDRYIACELAEFVLE